MSTADQAGSDSARTDGAAGTTDPARTEDPAQLPAPLAIHAAGDTAALADYPDTDAVLAAAAALRAVAPAGLVDLIAAERTLLLIGRTPADAQELAARLHRLDAADAEDTASRSVQVEVAYDGEDLSELAAALDISPETLIERHAGTQWEAAFGGFAPGFAYLLPVGDDAPFPELPRRTEPRTRVPAGAVGLASRYCGIYPRSSPGGWQLIGRTETVLFDPERADPALLTPGTRVRFRPARQRAIASALSPARRAVTAMDSAVGSARRAIWDRRPAAAETGTPVLTVLETGPLTLVQDAGRPGHGSIGVATSGAADHLALTRANLAVGNPPHAAALEVLMGPLTVRARNPVIVATAGAGGPVRVRRTAKPDARTADEADGSEGGGEARGPDARAPGPEVESVGASGGPARPRAGSSAPDESREAREELHRVAAGPLALDAGDELTLGPSESGLRMLLAVRGGVAADALLGSCSRDTLSDLGPEPLAAGDVIRAGPAHGLDAVPPPAAEEGAAAQGAAPRAGEVTSGPPSPPAAGETTIPLVLGPRHELLGNEAVDALLELSWTVRQDSDRIGIRLEGEPLPVPEGASTLPSEGIVPGAIQVPPGGLPVVFGPDHPTTGGYPVIAVVTREGLDLLAQAAPGAALRFTLQPRLAQS